VNERKRGHRPQGADVVRIGKRVFAV